MLKILYLKNVSLSGTRFSTNHARLLYTSNDNIQFNLVNNIGLVTLNRPKQLNALTHLMKKSLAEKLKDFNNNTTVQAILVKSSNNKAFSAGGDLKETLKLCTSSDIYDFFSTQYKLVYQIASLSKPYICILNGITFGAGAGISMNAKYRIATENTLFAMPETAIGFVPDNGFFYFFNKLPDNISLFMGLTGSQIKGKDARRLGIATHFINEEDLLSFVNDLLASQNVCEELDGILAKYDRVCEGKCLTHQIHRNFNEISLEKIFKNLEADGSDWSKKQLAVLKKMSPSSLHITMKQYEMEKKMSLDEALKLEYQIAYNRLSIKSNDCIEGVRSVIIDKNHNPKWRPGCIHECEPSEINAIFKKRIEFDELTFNYN